MRFKTLAFIDDYIFLLGYYVIMEREINQLVKDFFEQLRDTEYFSKIEFIILYGSSLGLYHLDDSDIDICLYIDDEEKTLSEIRLELLKKFNENFDIQMFQLLPLYVQIEVLKGKILYVKEEDRIYEIAYETIEEYEEFYPFYLDYINR
ncbi:MAG: nucleotidyltransferase domain-containing protein [Candidatus Lokiarchaeota archaeon]|nr:nucleotidyltransferase domain-containing protein [Candidatus Lokiarchaeota archaeon]